MKFYTFDEVLPLVDANSTTYCELIANAYVIGVDTKNEKYPIVTLKDAGEADYYTEELTKQLERTTDVTSTHNSDDGDMLSGFAFEDAPKDTTDDSALLEGFTFVPNKGMARIYVGDSDKTTRIYLKGGFEALLGVKPGKRILIAFNRSEQAFAVVKPTSPALTAEMKEAGYFVSKRKDVTCARLFRDFNLEQFRGKTFYADETSLSGNVVIFRM